MLKRLFDVIFSVLGIFLFFWLLLLAWGIAILDTRTNGIFTQERIGRYGKRFKIYKLRTIQLNSGTEIVQITRIGRLLRNYKLDELPQLINVLKGEMSVVGPRPDISGYYDLLEGEKRKILELKPGLTSPASLKYYKEDELLDAQDDAKGFNDNVLFPDKVQLNLEYYYRQSFCGDLKIIFNTCKLLISRNKEQ
ncbi:sugar transferase [Flavobacterium sp. NAS39]|uniref:Sugar transferase n=1 Tax=Flavobacterium taihuense TaxID=2857508 RepID=A0ABS6XUK0_9FLAO|nr:sugar transferase [Flavobacterium taihuense]